MSETPSTVFISYSHDSPKHSERVLAFANKLRESGIDVELDQYHFRPPQGWPRWCEEKIRPSASRFVLLICTETYLNRIEGKVAANEGRGVYWEGGLIFNFIYTLKENHRFIPVLFDDGDESFIPMSLQGHGHYRVHEFDLTDSGFQSLYRELTDQPAVTKPILGEVVNLENLSPLKVQIQTPVAPLAAATKFQDVAMTIPAADGPASNAALKISREKLTFLQQQEATLSDKQQLSQLTELINQVKGTIRDLSATQASHETLRKPGRWSGRRFNVSVTVAILGLLVVVAPAIVNYFEPTSLGAVSTGGPLASTKTLSIPLEGLTLSDAVVTAIGPGLRGSAAEESPHPKSVEASTLEDIIKADVATIRARGFGDGDLEVDANIVRVVQQLSKYGDSSAELERKLTERLNLAKLDGVFRELGADLNFSKIEETFHILCSTLSHIIRLHQTPSKADMVSVQLTRRNGDRIIIPLPMVLNYRPGHIRLYDGDQVLVVQHATTESGQPGTEYCPVINFDLDVSSVNVNLLILTHTSARDGKPEQYLLATDNPQYYGDAQFVREWIHYTWLHTGDQLGVGTLESYPLIPNGANDGIATSSKAPPRSAVPDAFGLRVTFKAITTESEAEE